VPIAIYGSQKARNWKRLQFPKVTVQYGEPMAFDQVEDPTREQQQAVADDVFARIRHLYADLERLGRKGMVQRVREQRRAEGRDGRTATA
jgi:1-acyl-sn-glycerol-3-phosphate acyltransferase